MSSTEAWIALGALVVSVLSFGYAVKKGEQNADSTAAV